MFADLDTIFEDGYKKVQNEYAKEQEGFIEIIAEARGMPAGWIESVQGVFIPNNDFMLEVFGNGILEYDCYRNGVCVWSNALVFPIRGVNGKVAGFGGFFPLEYVSEDSNANTYAYSSSTVFQKKRYLYFPAGDIMQAINDGYLCLVDGMFDAISLCNTGFHAAAMMGSSLSQEIVMQLRFVRHVILIADNDEAGFKLYEKLKKRISGLELLKHSGGKDADDEIKSEHSAEFIGKLKGFIKSLDSRDQIGIEMGV